jgi:hypothetical protein
MGQRARALAAGDGVVAAGLGQTMRRRAEMRAEGELAMPRDVDICIMLSQDSSLRSVLILLDQWKSQINVDPT